MPPLMLKEVGAITAKVGDVLPDISLPSTRGRPLSPAEFRGKHHVVLYFFPKNDAPYAELAGCTTEAQGFRDVIEPLRAMSAQVLGVSRQTLEELKAFSEAHHLNFPLLSDAEGRLGGALGVPEVHVKKEILWKRVTFLANVHGIIRKIYPQVLPEKHAQEVLTGLLDVARR